MPIIFFSHFLVKWREPLNFFYPHNHKERKKQITYWELALSSIYPPIIHPSILPMYIFIYPSIPPSVHPIYPCIHSTIHPSSIYASTIYYLSSIYLSTKLLITYLSSTYHLCIIYLLIYVKYTKSLSDLLILFLPSHPIYNLLFSPAGPIYVLSGYHCHSSQKALSSHSYTSALVCLLLLPLTLPSLHVHTADGMIFGKNTSRLNTLKAFPLSPG